MEDCVEMGAEMTENSNLSSIQDISACNDFVLALDFKNLLF